MLRRDTEYVLTWNARDHSWLARPIQREGDAIVRIGPGGTRVDAPGWLDASGSAPWDE